MAKSEGEYFIRHLGDNDYTVSKFLDVGAQPDKVYHVTVRPDGTGKCDCPSYEYRRVGVADKHIRMVKRWNETGRKIQGITDVKAFLA